jgi:7,8-dihydropterin-6-yl-methyl-4-(beta-D-ribofuranosyl)aminobenzene 5'-phosphate synthase
MLAAVRHIKEAKAATPNARQELIVDLHPDRPDFRGFQGPGFPVSLEADPTFEEIENAGGIVSKNDSVHTVLDDMFLISGFIPRQTPYERGLRRGIRFENAVGAWVEDTVMADERYVMCKVKGIAFPSHFLLSYSLKSFCFLCGTSLTLTGKGVVVFTGCSHAGVVNAARDATDVGLGAPLFSVVGGFHLADAEAEQVQETVRDLKALGPKLLLPGHCSGWRVKQAIESAMPGSLAPSTVGTRFTF